MYVRSGTLTAIATLCVCTILAALAEDARDILIPETGEKYFGAFTTMSGEASDEKFREFAEVAGKAPRIRMVFTPWAKPGEAVNFPERFFEMAYRSGAIPMVTWEPWFMFSKTDYPLLVDIDAGRYDDYVKTFAGRAAAFDRPFFLRFGHEMEGAHYPWSERFDKRQSAANYVTAFRHIAELCREVAPKAVIVWSPGTGVHDADRYYPGDSYVDWIGCSLYNFPGYPQDPTFRDALGWWIEIVRRHDKPGMVCEMGCADTFTPNKSWDPNGDGDYSDHKAWADPDMADKARWIDRFFDVIEDQYPEVLGFVWFQIDKEADWRINSAPTSTATFRRRVADQRYLSATVPSSD